MSFAAIIVAAGSGRRMGFDKLLAPLAGKPVLRHAIEAFLSVPELSQLILVCDEMRFSQVIPESSQMNIERVNGGSERHFSVAAGLEGVKPEIEWIAVHDGARPLIQTTQIQACLDAAKRSGAASCARRLTETVKRADESGRIIEAVDRTNLWAMETPQIFRADWLREAYAAVLTAGRLVTDEVSALEEIGIATQLVENPTPNLKITYPSDLALAERLRGH